MIHRHTFDGGRSSVTGARQFAASVLDGMPTSFVDAVILMVSELATNAVVHAHSRFELVIDCEPDEVVVSLSDHGAGDATPQNPRITDVSGRGLQIVSALADTWGVQGESSDWRKSVWFALRLPERASEPGGG